MEPMLENIESVQSARYELEVLCASWNPLAATLAEPVAACRELVTDLTAADPDGFLASFYRAQQG